MEFVERPRLSMCPMIPTTTRNWVNLRSEGCSVTQTLFTVVTVVGANGATITVVLAATVSVMNGAP